MKFIIAASTVAQLNAGSDEIINVIAAELGGSGAEVSALIALDDTHVNHSIKLIDGEYVFEVNDEAAVKCMALYVKVAKYITPFIKAFHGLVSLVKTDLDALNEFMNAKK